MDLSPKKVLLKLFLTFFVFSTSQNIICKYCDCNSMELQQRAVEYSTLFIKHDNLRPGVLERMPQFEKPIKHDNDDEDHNHIDESDPVVNQLSVDLKYNEEKVN